LKIEGNNLLLQIFRLYLYEYNFSTKDLKIIEAIQPARTGGRPSTRTKEFFAQEGLSIDEVTMIALGL